MQVRNEQDAICYDDGTNTDDGRGFVGGICANGGDAFVCSSNANNPDRAVDAVVADDAKL